LTDLPCNTLIINALQNGANEKFDRGKKA